MIATLRSDRMEEFDLIFFLVAEMNRDRERQRARLLMTGAEGVAMGRNSN